METFGRGDQKEGVKTGGGVEWGGESRSVS